MTKFSVVLAATAFVLVGVQAGPALGAAANPAGPVPAAGSSSTAACDPPEGELSKISVTGRGVAQTTPDVMHLSVGVEVHMAKAGDAFAAVKVAAGKLTDALLAQGVAPSDLRTNDLSLGAEYDKDPKPTGYRASQGVEVQIHDLSKADAIVDAIVAVGDEVRLNGISFEVSRQETLLKVARAAAYQDALDKAQQYASLAGGQVGRILRLGEDGEAATPRYALAGNASIMPGQSSVAISVRAVYELSWAATGAEQRKGCGPLDRR